MTFLYIHLFISFILLSIFVIEKYGEKIELWEYAMIFTPVLSELALLFVLYAYFVDINVMTALDKITDRLMEYADKLQKKAEERKKKK